MYVDWAYLPDGETIVITKRDGRKRSWPKKYVLVEREGCIWMLSGALEGGRLNLGKAPDGPYKVTRKETYEIQIVVTNKWPARPSKKSAPKV